MEATIVVAAGNRLGESPLWHARDHALYWLDLIGAEVHRWHSAEGHSVHPIVERGPLGGAVPVGEPARLLIAGADGLVEHDLRTGGQRLVQHPLAGVEQTQYNDAKSDREGRVWLTTSHTEETEPRGGLFRLEQDGAVQVDGGFVVGNGPAFSPSGETMYLSDSLAHRVLAYTVEPGGDVHGRHTFVSIAPPAMPDGLTVDAQGFVWVALWAGAAVHRYSPEGQLDAVIRLPARHATSVAFGNADLRTLFITTATEGLGPTETSAADGALLAVTTTVAGIPEAVVAASA